MRRVLFALAVALLMSRSVFAADADHDLTLKVKSAIAAESSLRNVNVMVSVHDGVVVIGGPVGHAEISKTLAKAVKSVPGVSDVRVNCWVVAGEDPLNRAVKDKLHPPAVQAKPVALLPLALPATLDAKSAYSPVPPPAPPAPPGPSEHATIPSPRVPITPSQDVATAVETVRKSDVRFDGLVLSVNAGTVTIVAKAGDPADAWALAAAVRKVPGVDRVIVANGKPS